MKSAVCLVIERDGKYLSISRRGDNTKWGFPGGKVDPLESNAEAIQREALEEIRLFASTLYLEPIHVSKCPGEVDYWVTTYLFTDSNPVTDEELKAEEGMELAWKTEEELCDPAISPFANYNKKVFAALADFR